MYLLTKEEYKNRISSSPLFSLNREDSPVAYKREAYKMIDNVFGYLLCVDEETNKNYGIEISETVKRCIKRFDKLKGDFLSYFLKAWKVQLGRVKAKETEDSRYGGMLTEGDKRKLRAIIRYARKIGKNYLSKSFAGTVAKATGIKVGDVETFIGLMSVNVVQAEITDKDGEEFDLLETVADEKSSFGGTSDEDEQKIFIGKLKELENVYASLGNRDSVKRVFRMTVSARIVDEFGTAERALKTVAENVTFLEERVVRYFSENKKIPTDTIMAEWCGVSDESFNRTKNKSIEPKLGKIFNKKEV